MQSIADRLRPHNPRRPEPVEPIPISLVITDLDVGGAERALVELAKGLDRKLFSPTLICLSREGELAGVLRDAGIPVLCLDVSSRKPITALKALTRALRQTRPRLIQSFLFHANVASRIAALFAGRAWVVSGHRVAERRKAWHLLIDRLTAGLCCGTVCVSEGVWKFTRFEARWPSDRLVVIPNGIDPSAYIDVQPIPRHELGVPETAPVALFVGRLDEQKGLVHLLDAAEIVLATVPNWHLLVVGDGPLAGHLQAHCQAVPALVDHVDWLGRRIDVPRLLKTADVLVLPSLWEGMPNVVLEAMASGKAVIATRAEGSDELVVPGSTGWLVPPADPKALAKAIIESVANLELTNALGMTGRQRVEEHFTQSRVTKAYQALWAAILGIENRFEAGDQAT